MFSPLPPLRLLGLFLFLYGFVAVSSPGGAAETVEQWGVFELTLPGPSDGNPFTDVDLSARFTQQDHVVEVHGFYDGEGVYKIRFMPETVGGWHYETKSNLASLAGKTGEIVAGPPSKDNHGPVRVAHTFHFAYADGTPFKQIGTTSYSWAHRLDEQEERTLKTLAASPFNKIRMGVFPQGGIAANARFQPFEGTRPKTWDTTRFSPAYFRHFEQRVTELSTRGIQADLILFHPYDKVSGLHSMDAASDDRYVRYLVARLAAYRNVWWSLANEYDLMHGKTEADWDRLFQVVQANDPYHHLRSIHHSVIIYNNNQPWVTHASLQNGAAVLDPERAELYRDVYRKPVVYDEVKYEGDLDIRWGQLTGEDLVLRFWNGLVAGTYVGHGEVFRNTTDRWTGGGGELHGQSVPRLAFLKTIMDDSPPEGIEPIDKWQERRMGGKAGDYYLMYFGVAAPKEWPFELYKDALSDGIKFKVEVIDTWAMTITPIDGLFETKKRDRYVFVDKDNRSVPLPGKPYQAIRIRRQP